jgi:putative addiction module component (TIGR02574 family)
MPNAADFEDLPVAEKVLLVTQLWDQIAKAETPITLPSSVLIEAERRLDEMIADPSMGITEEEMWRRADALRK